MLAEKAYLIAVLFILCVGYGSRLSAQSPETPEYADTIKKALLEYNEGRWNEARALFERAHRIRPSARTLRGMGNAAYKARDYASALMYLKQALDDNREPLTEEQRNKTIKIIAQAETFVGRFKVRLIPGKTTITVNGYPAQLQEGELLLNAGEQDVIARAEGYANKRLHVSVRGGKNGELEFRLRPLDGSALSEAGEPITDVTANGGKSTADESESQTGLAPYLVMGAGGAMLIGSAITGMLSYMDENELNDNCDSDGLCPDNLKATKERGEALQVASFVLLGTGVAAAATGVILLLFSGDERKLSATGSVSLSCDPESCLGFVTSRF